MEQRRRSAAGYAENSAAVTASRLLSQPNVKSTLAKLTTKCAEKFEIDADTSSEASRKRSNAAGKSGRC